MYFFYSYDNLWNITHHTVSWFMEGYLSYVFFFLWLSPFVFRFLENCWLFFIIFTCVCTLLIFQTLIFLNFKEGIWTCFLIFPIFNFSTTSQTFLSSPLLHPSLFLHPENIWCFFKRRPHGQQEIEAHGMTHIPFRTWCPHCVRGKASQSPHMKQNECPRSVWTTSYWETPTKKQNPTNATEFHVLLIWVDKVAVEHKGRDEWTVRRTVQCIANYFENWEREFDCDIGGRQRKPSGQKILYPKAVQSENMGAMEQSNDVFERWQGTSEQCGTTLRRSWSHTWSSKSVSTVADHWCSRSHYEVQRRWRKTNAIWKNQRKTMFETVGGGQFDRM